MIWIIIGVVVAVVVGFLAWLVIADRMKEKKVRQEGRVVLASLVMANQTLYKPDGDPETAGVVVFSFDDPSPELRSVLMSTGERVYDLYTAENLDVLSAPQRDVAAIIKKHNYTEARRNRLPDELSAGRTIYLADLYIKRDRLPDGWETQRALVCMATGVEDGQIIMLHANEPAAQPIYAAMPRI